MEQRIQSQQIPEDTIQAMTTEELFESFLSLPSRIRMLEFSALQEGFDGMRERFNVLSALMDREDVGEVALRRYLTFRIDETNNTDFDYQFTIDMTAILLSQKEVISALSGDEKENIVAHALSIFYASDTLSNSTYWPIPTLVLIGRILFADGFPPFIRATAINPEIEKMLDDGVPYEIPGQLELKDILRIASEYAT